MLGGTFAREKGHVCLCVVCGGALLLSHVATRHEVDRDKNTQDERAVRENCHPKYGCCLDKVRRTMKSSEKIHTYTHRDTFSSQEIHLEG